MAVKADYLKPGFFSSFLRILNDVFIRQWGVEKQNCLLGCISLQSTPSSTDNIWLAINPQHEDEAISILLHTVRKNSDPYRPISLDYPAGRAEDLITSIGFNKQHTLIWMQASR